MPKYAVICEGSNCRVLLVRKEGNKEYVNTGTGKKEIKGKAIKKFNSREAAERLRKSLVNKGEVKAVAKRQKLKPMKRDSVVKRVDRRVAGALGGMATLAALMAGARAMGWSREDVMKMMRIPSMPDVSEAKQEASKLMEKMLHKVMPSADMGMVRVYAGQLADAVVEMMKMPITKTREQMMKRELKRVGVPASVVDNTFKTMKPVFEQIKEAQKLIPTGLVTEVTMPRRSFEEVNFEDRAMRQGMPGYVDEEVERLDFRVPPAPTPSPNVSPPSSPRGFFDRFRRRSSRSNSISYGKRPHYRRMGRFGAAPNLNQMTGFVRPPFNISMAESYTGMRPRAYLRHAMSPAGSPVTMRKGTGVAEANSFYDSYGMGLKLNPPAFGRPKRKRRSKFGAKRPKSVSKRPKSVSKRPKTVSKAVKTRAKKHGIRLTVMRNGKRVPKSEKELLRQIKNKMKAKSVSKKPKRKVSKKPKRKVVKRKSKVAKHRVRRRTAKFGKSDPFFF